MIKYKIPQKELDTVYEEVGLDKEKIIVLWKCRFNGSKVFNPTIEDFIIYNLLRGENLYKGIHGKCETTYFREVLESKHVKQWHPYQQHYYTLMYMVTKIDRMFNKYSVFDHEADVFATSQLYYKNWFGWLGYDVLGKLWGNKKRTVTYQFNSKLKIQFITLLRKHLELAQKELSETIHGDLVKHSAKVLTK